MSDYGTARREFWERAFCAATIAQDSPLLTSDIPDIVDFADESLEAWEKRWLVEEKETDAG